MSAFPVGPYGWFHLLFVGVYLPLAAVRSRRTLRSGLAVPSLREHFRGAAFTQLVLVSMSLLTARMESIALFPPRPPRPAGVAAGIIMLAATVAVMRPRWRRTIEERTPLVRMFMPRDRHERSLWVALSVLAGIGEEITWRGVQVALLARLTGAPIAAAAIASAGFGVAHMVQGWRSAASIVGIAAGCHLVAWLSGSLYVVMAVHVLYDVTAGLTYGRLARELGYDAGAIESRA